MSTVNGPLNGTSSEVEPGQLSNAPPPPPTGAAMSTQYFFMKTSEKKKLQKQQEAEAASAQPKARAPTPNPTTDDEQPEASKPKPPRKPRAPVKKRESKSRKPKLEPPPPQSQEPTSSPAINLASTRTEIDPITAAAATPLTPSSSPPAANEETMPETEAEVGPNPRKSKRRKKSPPVVSFRMIVDDETGMILSSPAQGGRILANQNNAVNIPEFSLRPEEPPSSPVLPATRINEGTDTEISRPVTPIHSSRRTRATYRKDLGIPIIRSSPPPPSSPVLPAIRANEGTDTEISRPTTPNHGSRRTRVTYRKDLGILIIKSSPPPSSPPPQPVRKNAFAMLGKKKVPEKALGKTGKEEADAAPIDSSTNAERKSMKTPGRKGRKKDQTEEDVPPVEGSANAELKPAKTSSRKSRKKDQKKDAIVLSESSLETASTNDPMPPDPKVAVPPSEAPFTSNKVLHPFFSAAGRKKMAEAAPLPPEITEDGGTKVDSTIAPPRPSSRAASGPPNKSNWGFMTGFTNSRSDRVTKAPGMADAPWPVQGTSHVRGLSPSDVMAYTGHSLGQRKLKTSSVIVQVDEDILNRLAKQLHIGCLRDNLCSDDYESRKYINVSPEVRLPKRILTTGTQLQKMIRLRISTRLPHPKAISQVQQVDSDSELSSSEMIIAGTNVHPALFRLYKRLGTELTAFDMHKCEATPWEVKYAAETIGETLQPGKEKDILKKWLIRLKTDKVHVETGASAKRKAKGNVAAAKKKRKKKDDDLDSFVVTSEEELNMMDEITDPEEEDWINPATKTKKSTVRAGDKLGELDAFLGKTKDHKKTNTIVISGPIGCGKTATVFAVAKELGYTVFEVNPGSRRNGKDVLDLVGDMSRNHLVHHAKNAPETNNPFAKVKAAKEGTNTLEEDLQMRQKQSLILFEEVDILFEEDKNFWSTVISLMAKSKRPVVLTCNDESLLPWDDLSLHAILRFSPAPRSLLVDHLLLMSANEGHLLQRSAVEALAAANKDDIRACIMDLQFYCRMAVGDRKGGLGWLVDRWPVGCDIAENGEPLRVVSEDTYYEGIGFVPNSPDIKEEDKWRDVWDEYGLDIGASEEGLEECAGEIEVKGVKKKVSLTIAHEFFEARSAADAFSSLASSGIDEPKLDFTLPKRNEKTILDDLYGHHTVQTDNHVVPGSIKTDISIYMRSLARQYLTSETQKVSISLAPITNDQIISSILFRHETENFSRMQLQDLFAPLTKAETMFAATPATIHSSIYPSARLLATEVASWVRSILRYDVAMEKERRKASSLLSVGGKRRTRAARLAVEGGDRRRKERWLRCLGADVISRSSGEGWLPPQQQTEGKVGSDGDGDEDQEMEDV